MVLAGDYNVVPTDKDIYAFKSSYAEERAAAAGARARPMRGCSSRAGRTRSGRLHPDETIYTFWDYLRKRWEADGGLRIDHILLSKPLAKKLKAAGVDRHVRGWENASDHAPVWAEHQRLIAGAR